MEARAGSAGDGDEQQRQQRLAVQHAVPALEMDRRIGHRDPAEQGAAQAGGNDQVEQPASQVPPRLQQQPDRDDRGKETVAEEDDVPTLDRDGGEQLQQRRRQLRSDPDDQHDQRQEYQGRLARLPVPAVQKHAHGHGRQDVEQGRGSHAGAECFALRADGAKGLGGDVGKGGDDVNQAQPDKNQEKPVGGRRQVAAHDLADRRPLLRTEAVRLEKSWTPPIKMEPRMIHSSAGSQPNQMPASTGPTIGPAAAMAEKCCPSSSPAEAGT